MPEKYYITTTLPYVNADPHIGFAAEIVRADVLARAAALEGREVFFNTGTDEHGLKIYRKAAEQGLAPQAYVDEYAVRFDKLKAALDLSYNSFTRTTGAHHIAAAQEFRRRCLDHGDIYKKIYRVKYCVGCELEKTDSELQDGRCPLHPGQPVETIEEENYFFRFSKYAEKLLQLYADDPDFIMPRHRVNEMRNFIGQGLQDFSVSRLKEKMPWGVPVPDDPDQVMYVWFDALVNYVSCLGWPEDEARLKAFWGEAADRRAIQVAGKDNLRQQTAMWQAMLMSAGLPCSKQVFIFGFITAGGQKMSKSLGNVVSPFALAEKYGTDATRYLLLAELATFEDSDYSQEKFDARYNADLANGLGNLAARTANMIEKNSLQIDFTDYRDAALGERFGALIKQGAFPEALSVLWAALRDMDRALSEARPWKMTDKVEIGKILTPVAHGLRQAGELLEPIMPTVSRKIAGQFTAPLICKGEPLFPRI